MLATASLGLRAALSVALESACSTSGRVECVRRIATSTRCERVVLAPKLDVRPVEGEAWAPAGRGWSSTSGIPRAPPGAAVGWPFRSLSALCCFHAGDGELPPTQPELVEKV